MIPPILAANRILVLEELFEGTRKRALNQGTAEAIYPLVDEGAGYSCQDGALYAAFICQLLNLPYRLCVGLYYHDGPEYLAELRDEPIDEVVEPFDEHHHWVVVSPDSPSGHMWLLDPNGECRGEARLQVVEADDYLVYQGDYSLKEWWSQGKPEDIPDGVRYVADDALNMIYSSKDNPTKIIAAAKEDWRATLQCLQEVITEQGIELPNPKPLQRLLQPEIPLAL